MVRNGNVTETARCVTASQVMERDELGIGRNIHTVYTLVYNMCIGTIISLDTHVLLQTQYNPSKPYVKR